MRTYFFYKKEFAKAFRDDRSLQTTCTNKTWQLYSLISLIDRRDIFFTLMNASLHCVCDFSSFCNVLEITTGVWKLFQYIPPSPLDGVLILTIVEGFLVCECVDRFYRHIVVTCVILPMSKLMLAKSFDCLLHFNQTL